ncbi:MAG: hypothetical protein QM504_13780 [Pseudomonadota bacterium]
MRYILTLKKVLKYSDEQKIRTEKSQQQSNTVPSWFDMFKDIAMRMNEDWREDLLARCVAIEDSDSGSVSLKLLWHIGSTRS